MKLYDDPISFELFSIPARVWTLTMNSYGMFYKSKQTSENRWRCEIPFEFADILIFSVTPDVAELTTNSLNFAV